MSSAATIAAILVAVILAAAAALGLRRLLRGRSRWLQAGTWVVAVWVPGTGGAGVVLLHGSHDSRSDLVAHLRLLHEAGFAVLAVDARGHGASGGRPNALGWAGTEDVAGAVRYLHAQGIHRERIGPAAEVWEIPRAPHTGGLETDAVAYRQRVVAFLRVALDADRPSGASRAPRSRPTS